MTLTTGLHAIHRDWWIIWLMSQLLFLDIISWSRIHSFGKRCKKISDRRSYYNNTDDMLFSGRQNKSFRFKRCQWPTRKCRTDSGIIKLKWLYCCSILNVLILTLLYVKFIKFSKGSEYHLFGKELLTCTFIVYCPSFPMMFGIIFEFWLGQFLRYLH